MDEETKKLIHNIRNPVNTISMNAELGKLCLERTEDIAKATEIFDIILRECRQCGEQVNALKSHLDTAGRNDN